MQEPVPLPIPDVNVVYLLSRCRLSMRFLCFCIADNSVLYFTERLFTFSGYSIPIC